MFVQIGSTAFNPNWITYISFNDKEGSVRILLKADEQPIVYYGDKYNAFMLWWEKADVHKAG